MDPASLSPPRPLHCSQPSQPNLSALLRLDDATAHEPAVPSIHYAPPFATSLYEANWHYACLPRTSSLPHSAARLNRNPRPPPVPPSPPPPHQLCTLQHAPRQHIQTILAQTSSTHSASGRSSHPLHPLRACFLACPPLPPTEPPATPLHYQTPVRFQSIWAQHFGEPGLVSAPKLTDFIRTSVDNKYSDSMKITATLDHISHCKAASSISWSNRWTYKLVEQMEPEYSIHHKHSPPFDL